MLEELAVNSEGASFWAVASLLFFFAFFLVVTVRALRARPEELEAQARLVFDDESRPRADVPSGTGTNA